MPACVVVGELWMRAARAATLVAAIRAVGVVDGSRAALAAAAVVLVGAMLGPIGRTRRQSTLAAVGAALAALAAGAAFATDHLVIGVVASAVSQGACAGVVPEITDALARGTRSPRELARALRVVALGGSLATALGGIGAAVLAGRGAAWIVFAIAGLGVLATAAVVSPTPTRVTRSVLPDALKRYPQARASVVALAGLAAAGSGALAGALISRHATSAVSALLVGGALGVIAGTLVSLRPLPALVTASVVFAAGATVANSMGVAAFVVAGVALGVGEQAARTLLRRAAAPRAFAEVARGAEVVVAAAAVAGVGAAAILRGAGTFVLPALVLLVAVLLAWNRLRAVATACEPPLVELALLRSLPVFRGLPLPLAEGLAAGLERVGVPAGRLIVREGDAADCYYAIAAGEVDFSVGGRWVRTLGRGEGFGEIALLADSARTASGIATMDCDLYVLTREAFMTVLTGHDAARTAASAVARERSELTI